jgi:hypothetical protein
MKNSLILILLFIFSTTYGYQRKLYVDNFNNILGSYNLEKKLLDFCAKNNIKTLILYELHKVNKRLPLADSTKNKVLAKFISKARLEYNIEEISASGETGDFFLKAIHPYNQSRKKKEEKFNVYNLEFEFWKKGDYEDGGYYCETYLKKGAIPCTREGSFNYFIEALDIMKLLVDQDNCSVKIEAYIGITSTKEISTIAKYVDRLLVHAYKLDPEKSYLYSKERLNMLAEINSNIEVSIIYSAEGKFMGNWLKKNSYIKAENIFYNEIKNNPKVYKNINFNGFTYYTYKHLESSLRFYKLNHQN